MTSDTDPDFSDSPIPAFGSQDEIFDLADRLEELGERGLLYALVACVPGTCKAKCWCNIHEAGIDDTAALTLVVISMMEDQMRMAKDLESEDGEDGEGI